jgi:tetratricopeptide (TPR) repeat protein
VRGFAVALLSAAAIGAAQQPVRVPGMATPPEPTEASRMYEQYLTGDADAAVDYFARRARDPDAVSRVTAGSESSSPGGRRPGVDAYLSQLASNLFETEVGMRAGTFGKYAMSAPLESAKGSVGLNGMFEVRSLMVYRSMEDLLHRTTLEAPPAERTQIVDAIRSWYIVTTSHCLRWQLDCADALLSGARQRFGRDPEILLLAGAVAESHGDATAAQALLRQAITGDASLVEAHLRLGRLLAAAGRAIEARRELDRALVDARASDDAFGVYFASVSLADLDERAGRTTSAKAHTADAAAARPFGQPLFAGLRPTAIYRAAEFYQQPRRIGELRSLVRRPGSFLLVDLAAFKVRLALAALAG